MMNNKKMFFKAPLLGLLFCSLGILSCGNTYGQQCDRLFERIFFNTAGRNVNVEILEMGKEAIPCLIDFIDTDRKSFIGYQPPKSSTIYPFVVNNYVGIRAAYLIEILLQTDCSKVDTLSKKRELHGLYDYRVIVKVKDKEPILEPLSLEDMKIIKRIYMKWWNSNKTKTLKQLRNQRKSGDILIDKDYKWI